MKKDGYKNSVLHQVCDLKELAEIQREKCFDLDKLSGIMEAKACAGVKRVILTGCGDSYSAAGAMLPRFKKLSGLKLCNAPDIMDFCHYYTREKILRGQKPEEVLVVAISFSGSAERLAQALEKAAGLGTKTMIITRNPDSRGGRAAEMVFNVETPDGCNSPGLRSYYASMVGIAALGAYIGVCSGRLSKADFHRTGQEIAGYTIQFMEDLERIDEEMFAEAVRMKELRKFEVIGDGNEGSSAQFVEQKFIECSGVYCDHTTSEEFAHISYFFRGPEEFGTVVLVNGADKSLGRMKDTINGCLAQHRPTLVVTDLEASEFEVRQRDTGDVDNFYGIAEMGVNSMEKAGRASVCRIAKAPQQWMSPFVDFIPGSLLAAYHAAVNEHNFFNGRVDFRTETWIG